ncbi:hypothetical protein EW146_g8158 [Bondarzewia mesenterica]|uniref:FAD/NAD(P)-binding domain-containing protein n=1 Tax=Bondarzewia mesenterica TaxID=1095465 RepID=A0A4S4LHC7_9AGAM|nr:hypothetical protein EW146_g8158 [Bondarzewia mesenterica]
MKNAICIGAEHVTVVDYDENLVLKRLCFEHRVFIYSQYTYYRNAHHYQLYPGYPVMKRLAQLSPTADIQKHVPKRVAIVGGGTAGVTALKTLLVDLPVEARHDWDVVLFEQRQDVGGVWLPDPSTPQPPELPETPLYPRLMTNTPHPTMTIPHFPFRPETNLFPHHPDVKRYHADIIEHWNLSSHIKLNQEVLKGRWIGTANNGRWRLLVRDQLHDKTIETEFHHLIVANGHYHYPYEPVINGRKDWEKAANRSAFHSIYYRNPEDYTGRNVVVVGGGASGRDIAQQIVTCANSTYVSLKGNGYRNIPFPRIPGAEFKPRIHHFTSDSVVFEDNTTLSHIDTIIYGTGYENRVPFLTSTGHLSVNQTLTLDQLTTNLRYIYPLYRHVLSLDPSYPIGSLYFIGLPIFVANAISDSAQSLFTAYTISDPTLLPSRSELLEDLFTQESRIRGAGYDPAYVGHRLIGDHASESYQDGLVEFLQERGKAGHGSIPEAGQKFTEQWRKFGRDEGDIMRRGWQRVLDKGDQVVRSWLAGVETERDWVKLMKKLVDWEREQEVEEDTD